MTGDEVTGFDLYEHYRSQVFQTVLLVAPSWDALEMYERVAWDGLARHVQMIDRPTPLGYID